jgi:uncharacterized protein (TIGR00730 family)
MQSEYQSAVVFCGSKEGSNPVFMQHATQIGETLAQAGLKLIYGGGNKGLMGAVANGALAKNGQVIGIIPQQLVDWEHAHYGLTELIVVDNMHNRKRALYEMADFAIILPGGNGTLDELFELLTWNTLQLHHKKVVILNTEGFYNALLTHMQTMQQQGFLYENWQQDVLVITHPKELINAAFLNKN